MPQQQKPLSNSETPCSEKTEESDNILPPFAKERMEEIARVVEERRKERMKTLTRNLEVCDLLDIRNP